MWLSFSASVNYFVACKRAAESSSYLATFKSNRLFTNSTGTSSPAHLAAVLGRIWNAPTQSISGSFSNFGLSASLSGGYSGAFSAFTSNDSIGTPAYVLNTRYSPIGTDTGRFVESVYTLSSSFGNLNGKNIVEFGSNYGGLCHCIHQWWPTVGTYYMVDYPVVQSLSLAYFNSGGFDTSSLSYSDPSGSSYDIYISEYCLTEQDTASLYQHYYTYVQPATQGFLIRANFYDQMQFIKFMRTASLDFTCSVVDEPIFRIPNKIIVGIK